jgi:hypothetical protein
MTESRFKVGGMYFIGGYRDRQRTIPRQIRPVIYLGDEVISEARDILVFKFENLEAWIDRRGKGLPDPKCVQEIEGPPDMRLAMSLEELIEELKGLQARLD